MGSSSFLQSQIEIDIRLAGNTQTPQQATFAGTNGANTVTLRGKRTSVRVQNSGALSGSTAQVMIYGLSQSLMNQLATLGMKGNKVPTNSVTVRAGKMDQAFSVVFVGNAIEAYADYSGIPDVPFIFNCQSQSAIGVQMLTPTSFSGSVPISQVMSGFARAQNLGFENNGVNGNLSNPYYRGSVNEQIDQCAKDGNFEYAIINGATLAIWPHGSPRNISQVPLIAPPPDGQMVGYPAFTQQGVVVTSVFDPTISLGGKVKVQTNEEALQKANGVWQVLKLDLALDALIPHGEWKSTAYCYEIDAANPVLPPP